MNDDVMAIPSWATVLVAAEFFVNRRLQAFPVIEDSGRLVGAVDAAIFTPEMRRLAAAVVRRHLPARRHQRHAERQCLGRVRQPLPVAALQHRRRAAGCGALEPLPALLDQAIVLALFIPVVLALSESVSIQSVTLALQALHTGTLGMRVLPRGLLARGRHGGHCSGRPAARILAVTSVVWKGDYRMSIAMGGAIAVSMTASALIGLAAPDAAARRPRQRAHRIGPDRARDGRHDHAPVLLFARRVDAALTGGGRRRAAPAVTPDRRAASAPTALDVVEVSVRLVEQILDRPCAARVEARDPDAQRQAVRAPGFGVERVEVLGEAAT